MAEPLAAPNRPEPAAPKPPAEAGTLIDRLIEASARNPFLVVVFVILGVAAGIYSLYQTPLDAIPDLSDVQVIVYADWEGRSPDLVEDQVTYPISTKFIPAPKVKFVRGESMFGKSFVYVIFQDDVLEIVQALDVTTTSNEKFSRRYFDCLAAHIPVAHLDGVNNVPDRNVVG